MSNAQIEGLTYAAKAGKMTSIAERAIKLAEELAARVDASDAPWYIKESKKLQVEALKKELREAR